MNTLPASRFTIVFLVIACILFSPCRMQGNGKTVNFTKVVNTSFGPVRGKNVWLPTNRAVDQYLGIRFAKAERFEPPTAPDRWEAVFDAISFGKACSQPVLPINGTLRLEDVSEDCLFLNVYVSAMKPSGNQLLHVMHWIHGGGFMFGTGVQPGLEILAAEGNVIVVSSNYRLGALGFLATGQNDLRGNYGMLDQIEAIKWVRNNIQRFGGNPNSITIFGESAGGFSVSLQTLSPLANGLFQKVIPQSGVANTLMATLSMNQAKDRAREFGLLFNCPNLSTLKQCLSGKPAQELAMAGLRLKSEAVFLPFVPVVDGNFLPDVPERLISQGEFSGRDTMLGFTRDEAGFFLIFGFPGTFPPVPGINKGINRSLFKGLVRNITWIKNQNLQNLDTMIFQYTNWTSPEHPNVTRQSYQDLFSDSVFKAPAVKMAQELVKKNVPTYLYQLEHGPAFHPFLGQVPKWMAAFHSADLTYVFGIPLLKPGANINDPDVRLSIDVMKMWSNFARTGNPTPDKSPLEWPRYTLHTQKYMALKPQLEVKAKVRAEYMIFWNKFLHAQTGVPPVCLQQLVAGAKFSHPTDCTKYIENVHGKLSERRCATGTYFSAAMQMCTWPHQSGCIARSKRD